MGRDRAPLRRAQRAHLRAGGRDQPQRRAGGALRRRRQPADRAARPRASGAPPATPTKRKSAASSARRWCRPRSSPRPTCPTWRRSCPAFNVESIEGHEVVTQRFQRKVEFESIDFNKRFLATVPKRVRPGGAARALQPRLPRLGDDDRAARSTSASTTASSGSSGACGERSEAELKAALKNAGQLFRRLQGEMDESGIHTYPPGPWHAGLEPFPDAQRAQAG